MTPDERDRLVRVETEFASFKKEVLADMVEIKADLKQLIEAANMGKGAWWLLMKIGGAILVLGAAFAWATDHAIQLFKYLKGI